MSDKDLLALTKNRNFPSAEAFVKAVLDHADHPDRVQRDTLAVGAGVWKLLLAANPQGQVLELGAGPYSLIHHLAESTGLACLADVSPGLLLFSKYFHKFINAKSTVSYIQLESMIELPFADNCFDSALINLQYCEGIINTGVWDELRRVLRPSGQLLLITKNRFDWQNLSIRNTLIPYNLSAFGYHRLLKKHQFTDPVSHALVYHDSNLRKVIRFTGKVGHNHEFPAPPTRNLKSRLKQGLLSSCYAIITGAGNRPTQLENIKDEANDKLQKILGPGSLQFLDHEITRKEKVVIFTKWNNRRLILKLPLSELAESTESNNARLLKHLQKHSGDIELIPQALLSGKLAQNCYFVESMLPGKPLSQLITTRGRSHFLAKVLQLLEQMTSWSLGPRSAAITLSGDTYQSMVQDPINTIARLTGDSALGSRLENFFRPRLEGVDIRTGLTHGDFSVSNILHNEGQPLSVIDWETANTQGVPILDAINFLDSMQRLSIRGIRINQTIPQLATRSWPEADELAFLDRCYEMHGINRDLHESLVYLRWLRHMGFLIRFWLRFDRPAQKKFIYDIADTLDGHR